MTTPPFRLGKSENEPLGATLSIEQEQSVNLMCYRGNSRARQQNNLSMPTAPLGSFYTESGRVVIHDGYFSAQIHRTQVLQDDNYAKYTEYVLRCQWQPKEMRESTTTIVEECKQGLGNYATQMLDLCVRLSKTLNVPELDSFFNLSRQVERYYRQLVSSTPSAAGEVGGAPDSGFGHALNVNASAADAMAAHEQAPGRGILNASIRIARGDLRHDPTVQHCPNDCIQLAPRLHIWSTLDKSNPRCDIVIREVTYSVRHNKQNAAFARDAIAKTLSAGSSIGRRTGERIAGPLLPYVGVLDTFGFEALQNNDPEELLGTTRMKLLDTEAKNSEHRDKKFLRTLLGKHAKHPHLSQPHAKDMKQMALVRHYASAVSDTSDSFINNSDNTTPQVMKPLPKLNQQVSGSAQMNSMSTPTGQVYTVEIPDDVSDNNCEQLNNWRERARRIGRRLSH
ncbi:hypothetical protein BBJ28_00015997 [Nothophytophthora sp. Chile5]|nr:hypothetical protein BBJ28_00015997 [Nothophytophthora sp. Chile5]